MPFESERRGWGQEEGAGDHGADEGKTKEEERVAVKRSPIGRSPGVLVRGGAKLIILECWHYAGGRVGGNTIKHHTIYR